MGGESAQATAERTNGQQTDSAAHWEQSGVSQSATASVLRELEFDGWTVLHDVRMPGRRRANVDHVVIGNGQVYVIDTEVWAGSVTVAGGVLRQNGRARQKRVTGVAEMARSIASLAPMLPPSTVHPVLCFVREDWVSERFGDVLVCSTENLVSTLRNEQEQVRGPAYLHNDLIRQLEDALKSQSTAAEPVPAKQTEPKAAKPAKEKRPKRVRTKLSFKAGKGTTFVVALALGIGSLLYFKPAAVASITDPVVENVTNFLSPGSDLPPSDITKPKKQGKNGKNKGNKNKNQDKQEQTQQ